MRFNCTQWAKASLLLLKSLIHHDTQLPHQTPSEAGNKRHLHHSTRRATLIDRLPSTGMPVHQGTATAPAATQQGRPAASPATTAVENSELHLPDRARNHRRWISRSRSQMGGHTLSGARRYGETLILPGIRCERQGERLRDKLGTKYGYHYSDLELRAIEHTFLLLHSCLGFSTKNVLPWSIPVELRMVETANS